MYTAIKKASDELVLLEKRVSQHDKTMCTLVSEDFLSQELLNYCSKNDISELEKQIKSLVSEENF